MNNMKKVRSGRKRTQMRNSMFRQHGKSIKIICSVLIMLAVVLSINAVSLYTRNEAYKHQEAELREQIKEQEARSEEVKAYQEYVQTDDYVKEVAEEKLGLVDPNEILFKPTE